MVAERVEAVAPARHRPPGIRGTTPAGQNSIPELNDIPLPRYPGLSGPWSAETQALRHSPRVLWRIRAAVPSLAFVRAAGVLLGDRAVERDDPEARVWLDLPERAMRIDLGRLAGAGHLSSANPPVRNTEPLPAYPGATSVRSAKEVVRPRHPARWLWKSAAMAAGVATVCAFGQYASEMHTGQERASRETPSISIALESTNPEAQQTIIYAFPGMSGNNAREDVSALTSLAEHGVVKAMRYGIIVDVERMARLIVEDALAHGVTDVILVGESMGGLVAADVAKAIATMDTPVRVRVVVMLSSPTSLGSVNPEKLAAADYIAAGLSVIPGVRYSATANAVAQFPGYLFDANPDHLERLSNQNVWEFLLDAAEFYWDKNSPDSATITLMESCFNAIVGAHLEADLQEMMQTEHGRLTLFLLVQATEKYDGERDDTVVGSVAASEFLDMVRRTGAMGTVLHFDGVYHGGLRRTPKEWNLGIEQKLVPFADAYFQALRRVRLRNDEQGIPTSSLPGTVSNVGDLAAAALATTGPSAAATSPARPRGASQSPPSTMVGPALPR